MALPTYGAKPISFQVEENGEYYYVGSDVGNYLGFLRGKLYTTYPGMSRRFVTNDERKKLIQLGLIRYAATSKVSLIRANEFEDIMEGNDDKYKTDSIHSKQQQPSRKGEFKRSMPSATKSSHIDTILPARKMNRNRLRDKKLRTSQRGLNDKNPSKNTGTGAQREMFMPIRSNKEMEAQRLGDMEVEETGSPGNSFQLEATYKQKCRLCLKNYDQFLELFNGDDDLPLKITALASVQIERGDGLPSVICSSCRQLLDISYNFKCLVEKSDSALRETMLLNRLKINQIGVKESLALSVNNDLHKKGAKRINRDNQLDDGKRTEKDEKDEKKKNIIPRSNRSQILLEDQGVSLSKSNGALIQSIESKSEAIKQEELLSPKVIDLSKEEDILFYRDVHKLELENNEDEDIVDDVPSESNKLETVECKISIERITGNDNQRLLNLESSEEKCSDYIKNCPTNLELPSHNASRENATELRYTCYWCEKQFYTIVRLMNHVTNNHDSLNNGNRVDIDNNYG